MKIGLLAYHSACNFGATLQLLSSYMFWKHEGHDPVVINYVPADLEAFYAQRTPAAQIQLQQQIRAELWQETPLCRTDKDVANIIAQEHIQAVVVGSDAVCQHHTIRERLVFPCKRIVAVNPVTSDRMFPHNPFWGSFNQYLPHPIPVAILSASSQDSQFHFFSARLMKQMSNAISKYAYLSVRDSWTAEMFNYVTHGQTTPCVTPDPVFAFNQNVNSIIPSKTDTIQKFHLPNQYVLCSFIRPNVVSNQWLNEFKDILHQQQIQLINLPFAHHPSYAMADQDIPLPLSPLDWYALIRHSLGYIGNNMHPIVVSLHNANPFFSFDNYGIADATHTDDSSSKIKHILSLAHLEPYRVSCLGDHSSYPTPDEVWNLLCHFPKQQVQQFADTYYTQYLTTMQQIQNAILC